MTVPTTGFFGGKPVEIEDEPHAYNMPIWEYMRDFRTHERRWIKQEAIRTVDIIAAHGKAGIELLPVRRWLELRGYIRLAEIHRGHWGWSIWRYELTEAGRKFWRENAAPIGEW